MGHFDITCAKYVWYATYIIRIIHRSDQDVVECNRNRVYLKPKK
jgi:hypothetical protein